MWKVGGKLEKCGKLEDQHKDSHVKGEYPHYEKSKRQPKEENSENVGARVREARDC